MAIITLEDVVVTVKPTVALTINIDKDVVENQGEAAPLSLKYALTITRLMHSGKMDAIARQLCPELFVPATVAANNEEEKANPTTN